MWDNRNELTQTLLDAKRKKNLSFEALAHELGRDPAYVAALFFGQATASPEDVQKLSKIFEISILDLAALTIPPFRGSLPTVIPTDPTVYSFYEFVAVYGVPLKALINEIFGDGVMSTADFSFQVLKEDHPTGERVNVVLSGKFIPFKAW